MMENEEKQILKKQDKEAKRLRYRELNEPPHLTVVEEVGNAVTHGVGALLAIVGFVLLLLKSDTDLKVMASLFYGISLIFLMTMSCLYHSFKSGLTVKRLWRRFDYCSIYLLIGGTFAPLYLITVGNQLGMILFCVQWGVILFGITMISVFGPGRLKWLHFSLYFVIGWSALIFLPGWYRTNFPLFFLILAGGFAYTLGMIPFVRQKKYSHFIWHFFVIAGAALHWFGIYYYVY